MRISAAFATLFTYVIANESGEVSDPDVEVLTESTFDDFVSGNKYVLAEFYAPWCGHCKALAPEYAKAATALKTTGSEVKLAKIDATEQKDLGQRFGVSGYPTLFWFVDGEKREYTGGRTEADILAWINRKTSDPYTTGSTVPEVGDKPLVVMKASSLSDDFKKVADQLGDDVQFHFVETTDGSDAVITLQHKGEAVLSNDGSDLKEFIDANVLPKFGILDGSSYGKYMSAGKGMVWILLPLSSSDELTSKVDEIRASFIDVASKHTDFKFVYIDTIVFQKAIEGMLGVTEFPAAVVHKKAGDKKKFILQGEEALDLAKLTSFLEDVDSGKIEPVLKSAPVPSENDKPVRDVVGSTMTEELFQAEKDILFEVYAPWCGHCKKLGPELDKLASKIRAEGLEDLIRITKMDGTENDSPIDSISWEGFPTMFYIKAGTSTAVPFNGGRDAKSIWKWIKANHSKSEDLNKRVADAKAAKEGNTEESEEGKDEL
jgi:protein disulfide isomerase